MVYKVDRLTRSLADFAKMVELFDAQNVSFVAVTQQFNDHLNGSADPQRAALVRAVRTRSDRRAHPRQDAASKRKGMWMGGYPPLGYGARDHHVARQILADREKSISEKPGEERKKARAARGRYL